MSMNVKYVDPKHSLIMSITSSMVNTRHLAEFLLAVVDCNGVIGMLVHSILYSPSFSPGVSLSAFCTGLFGPASLLLRDAMRSRKYSIASMSLGLPIVPYRSEKSFTCSKGSASFFPRVELYLSIIAVIPREFFAIQIGWAAAAAFCRSAIVHVVGSHW